MKQIKKTNSQSGFLDPEKVYFVEKFGHLLKKIDNGFGVPVQEALFQRVFMTVDDFKTDLPDVVHNLEKARLRGIGQNKKNVTKRKVEPQNTVTDRKPRVETDIIQKKVQIAETESKIIDRNVIETEIEVDVDMIEPQVSDVIEQQVGVVQQSDSNIKSSILQPSAATIREENRQKQIQGLSQKQSMQKVSDVIEQQVGVVQQSDSNIKSSILQPSAATIREENRQKQIQRMSQPQPKQKVVVKENIAPSISRTKRRPKKELTVWERAWDKFDRYSEEAMNGHA